MSRIRTWGIPVLCFVAVLQAGCLGGGGVSGFLPSSLSIASSLSGLDLSAFEDIPALAGLVNLAGLSPADLESLVSANTLQINVINRTGYTVQLDITADGAPYTLNCLADVPSRFQLRSCPAEVRLIAERWLDADSAVVGGRDYAGSDAYSFLPGSFRCGGTIVWQLTRTTVDKTAL